MTTGQRRFAVPPFPAMAGGPAEPVAANAGIAARSRPLAAFLADLRERSTLIRAGDHAGL